MSQSQSLDFGYYPGGITYSGIPYSNNNSSYESVFVNHHHQQQHPQYQQQHHHQQQRYQRPSIMSSAYPNQPQQLFSHLPRPTPYKSTMPWSHLTPPPSQQQQRRHQPQTYYPFQSPEFKQGQSDSQGGHPGSGPTPLWGIREEQGGTKSAESVLAGSSGHSSSSTISGSNNRYGSMECLSSVPPVTWKNSPGYRFSISTGPGDSPAGSLEALRREAASLTLQGPPGGFVPPTPASQHGQEMIVTMSGGVNEMSEGSSENSAMMKGYEVKMADRIRRSCEQKEEFLRRPNQPLQWAPMQSQSGLVGFPKEFYAQPQKFQKVPWPPENRIPTISSSTPPMSASTVVSDDMTVTMRNHHPNTSSSNHSHPNSNSMKPTVVNLHKSQMEQLRNYSGSLDETTVRRLETVSNKLKQQQGFPKSSVNINSGSGDSHNLSGSSAGPTSTPSFTVTDFSGVARNRLTVVGSGKLHCDPPPGWKHPSFDETEINVQTTNNGKKF